MYEHTHTPIFPLKHPHVHVCAHTHTHTHTCTPTVFTAFTHFCDFTLDAQSAQCHGHFTPGDRGHSIHWIGGWWAAEPILMLGRVKSLAAAVNWNHDSLDDLPRA